MLMILSAIDEHFSAKEDKIIKQYLIENFPGPVDLDQEMEVLSGMDPSDYLLHFNNMMNVFYMDSSPEDRNHFLDFAVKLAAADKKISTEENTYLNELFGAWEANYS